MPSLAFDESETRLLSIPPATDQTAEVARLRPCVRTLASCVTTRSGATFHDNQEPVGGLPLLALRRPVHPSNQGQVLLALRLQPRLLDRFNPAS